jgi:ABC-2 type transport system ATP-binding protein
MAPIIEVDRLTKRYRKATENAVDGVSFTVDPGTLFCLLGPNGAGKTTTISILTTTLVPTSGQVRIGGHDVVMASSAVRQTVGIIFQNPSLDMNLTAEENVRFHALLYGLYPWRPTYALMPEAYRRQVRELAGVVGLDGEMGKQIKTFSGGMRRKLEIVRTLLHRPRVLFLDEPTSGLDPQSRRSLWDYLRQVRAQTECTLFLSTHYLEESESADQVCILNHGRTVALGSPAAVKAELAQERLVLDAADREALHTELSRLGLRFSEPAPYRVTLDGQTVQQVIKAIDTPLSLVRVDAPSLEDAYLKIIAKEVGA